MATAVGFLAEDLNEANPVGWLELGSTAQCVRCGGLMVTEQCFDLLSDNGHLDFLPSAACSAANSWIRSSCGIAACGCYAVSRKAREV